MTERAQAIACASCQGLDVPTKLPLKEAVTLQTENEQSEFTSTLIANDLTNSIPKRKIRMYLSTSSIPKALRNFEGEVLRMKYIIIS